MDYDDFTSIPHETRENNPFLPQLTLTPEEEQALIDEHYVISNGDKYIHFSNDVHIKFEKVIRQLIEGGFDKEKIEPVIKKVGNFYEKVFDFRNDFLLHMETNPDPDFNSDVLKDHVHDMDMLDKILTEIENEFNLTLGGKKEGRYYGKSPMNNDKSRKVKSRRVKRRHTSSPSLISSKRRRGSQSRPSRARRTGSLPRRWSA